MKLTYRKRRGYYHIGCQICGAARRERIPDQVAPEYVHNPGNPILGVCPGCNGGRGLGGLSWGPQTAPQGHQDCQDGAERPQEGLAEPWATWAGIAHRFAGKARGQDREDLRHTIILRLAEVQARGQEPLSQGAMLRVASYVVHEYWRELTRRLSTLSLNGEIEDGEGNTTELWETLADDRAIDLDAWVDARIFLTGCPRRLVDIAQKRVNGIALAEAERKYLCKMRKGGVAQRPLFEG